MKKNFVFLSIIIFSACSPIELTPSVADIQTAIAETEIAILAPTTTALLPTATSISMPSETPLPSPTPTPSEPIFGTINVAFLNLRNGPSTLFEVLDTYVEGTELEILGKIEKNNWTKVIVTEEDKKITGWMSGDLLDIEIELSVIPITGFPLDQSINGNINLSTGEPIDNINITVTHRINEIETRHIATSNENGFFIVYYPENMQGLFDIQITGVLCTSSILDDNCQLTDYYKLDSRIFISIPQTEDIQFYYEAAAGNLKGNVINSFGNPVPNIVVAAERDDGAESSGRTDIDGNFEIPIGEGIWEVYALIVFPRNEGNRVSINVTDQIPVQIELISPD